MRMRLNQLRLFCYLPNPLASASTTAARDGMHHTARPLSIRQGTSLPRCSRQTSVRVCAVSSVRPASSPVPTEKSRPAAVEQDSQLSDVAQRLERTLEASSDAPRQAWLEPLTAASSAAPERDAFGREIILAAGETLTSSWQHRAWVAAGFGVMGALFAAGAARVHDVPSATAAIAAVVSAYAVAGVRPAIRRRIKRSSAALTITMLLG